jgi:hypothetical protein
MLCSFVVDCSFFVFYFVCPRIRVEDEVDRCRDLTLTAGFLVSSFLFLFCIWIIHVLDLVCTKRICYLNVIVYELAET